ncbi:MAG: DUF547 domain-containing protein [Longimonas sp.]|uniref:DUF547 domain-containing protein n=1 Tax=Longimonas sp. TaxID=2039626 RepID=UPI003975081B
MRSLHVRCWTPVLLLLALFVSIPATAQPADHSAFTDVLNTYVDAEHRVDYAQLRADRATTLDPYLEQLATADLESLSRDARLAFWMNAYNALTIALILEHDSIDTIWAITPGDTPETTEESPFELPVGTVADTMRTLDEIEHGIIRERFDEPRIHFALVCAAASCPPLRREAYTGDALDAQLEDQTRAFLHNPALNQIPATKDTLRLSRLFDWYQADFGPDAEAVQQYIAPYIDDPEVQEALRNGTYTVDYMPYDWALNAQR